MLLSQSPAIVLNPHSFLVVDIIIDLKNMTTVALLLTMLPTTPDRTWLSYNDITVSHTVRP